MGYDTDFVGQVTVDPPLNPYEVEYLDRFAETRHESRQQGPYAVNGNGLAVEEMYGGKEPPPGLPGYWCAWVPTAAGDALIWNGAEKFYDAEIWLAYLIDTFLKPGAVISGEPADPVPGRFFPSVFERFGCDHVLNGVITAEGDEEDDVWRIEVRDNVVHVVRRVDGPWHADTDPLAADPSTSARQAELAVRTRRNHVFVVGGDGEFRDLGPAAEAGFTPIDPVR
ncbi:hypothetical protein QLQ12_23110 [Actinoplanes sp. NEAU-A12]|uniref:Uncharacterized protein n=1 Tax=Actinoplanes sandaracinus TaxID=3045177 RepID=A0ABT6WP62_9ACTN|nr:hypothetical protein [Actinoplanes sandaracinus]MDI6101512.1 hypothetical protein [Actinoplanes sandaracinus]